MTSRPMARPRRPRWRRTTGWPSTQSGPPRAAKSVFTRCTPVRVISDSPYKTYMGVGGTFKRTARLAARSGGPPGTASTSPTPPPSRGWSRRPARPPPGYGSSWRPARRRACWTRAGPAAGGRVMKPQLPRSVFVYKIRRVTIVTERHSKTARLPSSSRRGPGQAGARGLRQRDAALGRGRKRRKKAGGARHGGARVVFTRPPPPVCVWFIRDSPYNIQNEHGEGGGGVKMGPPPAGQVERLYVGELSLSLLRRELDAAGCGQPWAVEPFPPTHVYLCLG
jgi:hypothetical protein